jgi:hypothetical protein
MRALATLYHLIVAFTAVSLLIAMMLTVLFGLSQGVLSYFFGIDLLQWLGEQIGVDLTGILESDPAPE